MHFRFNMQEKHKFKKKQYQMPKSTKSIYLNICYAIYRHLQT